MADSTCTLVASPVEDPPTPPPFRTKGALDFCSEPTRADLARLVDRQLPEITTAVLHGDPFMGGVPDQLPAAVAQLVHEAMPVVSRVCHRGRWATAADVVPFRFLGAVCAHQGIEPETAIATVGNAVEAVADLLLARGREFDDLYGRGNVDEAVATMCGQLENLAGRAAREIETGYARLEACPDGRPGEEGALSDVLDVRDDAEDESESDPPVLDPDTPRSVAVLVATGHRDDVPALTRAAQEMEVHVAGAVDLGLGDDQPTHWRVVIPRPFGNDARELYTVLSHIALTNGVVIVVRYPAEGLLSLRATYRDTVASLCEVIAAHGRRSSVVTSHSFTAPRTPMTVAA